MFNSYFLIGINTTLVNHQDVIVTLKSISPLMEVYWYKLFSVGKFGFYLKGFKLC